jgi:cytidine deaminase
VSRFRGDVPRRVGVAASALSAPPVALSEAVSPRPLPLCTGPRGIGQAADRVDTVHSMRHTTRTPSPQRTAILIAAARKARRYARAEFSHFRVGAALETAGGTIVTGCNIENATYGLTMCAERVALFKALSDGHRRFRRIAIAADTRAPTPPCGPCRQLLWEFCGDIEVVLANLRREHGRFGLRDLLPLPFDARLLR